MKAACQFPVDCVTGIWTLETLTGPGLGFLHLFWPWSGSWMEVLPPVRPKHFLIVLQLFQPFKKCLGGTGAGRQKAKSVKNTGRSSCLWSLWLSRKNCLGGRNETPNWWLKRMLFVNSWIRLLLYVLIDFLWNMESVCDDRSITMLFYALGKYTFTANVNFVEFLFHFNQQANKMCWLD